MRQLLLLIFMCVSSAIALAQDAEHDPVPEMFYARALAGILEHERFTLEDRCYPILVGKKQIVVIEEHPSSIENWDIVSHSTTPECNNKAVMIHGQSLRRLLPSNLTVGFTKSRQRFPDPDDKYLLVRFSQIYDEGNEKALFVRINWNMQAACLFYVTFASTLKDMSISNLSLHLSDDWQ